MIHYPSKKNTRTAPMVRSEAISHLLRPGQTEKLSRFNEMATLARRAGHLVIDEVGGNRLHLRLGVIQVAISCLPYLAAKRLRTILYRAAGFRIGARSVIYGQMTISGDGAIRNRLVIGSDCRINTPCRLDLSGTVCIGDRAVLGHDVTILTATHDITCPDRRAGRLISRPVVIGPGVWIAAKVTILPGITIGEGAVVGAGTVVTHDVPPHTFFAGNPGKVIRKFSCLGVEVCQ